MREYSCDNEHPGMVELQKLDTATLVDLLATHTANYLILSQNTTKDDEFAKCFLTIRAIQKEIESRKNDGGLKTKEKTNWVS